MARADLLSRLYLSSKSALEFNFDALQCNYNIFNIFSATDIGDINYITNSVKYMGDVKTRVSMIENLMKRRGFKKYHAGTNRQVYVFLDDRSFVAKTPIDSNGMRDNITEYNVQMNIKPCCTKTFQTTQFGEIAFCEKVDPIQTKEEFLSVADDIFYMLVYKILGKYIMDDIGTLKFMNYGIRRGWGPVILDYAKTFKLDGNKLICNKEVYQGIYCNGEIDYDEGFNNIVCKSCGTHYNAMELAELTSQHKIILSKGDLNMNVKLTKGNKVLVDSTKSPREMEIIRKQNVYDITPRLSKSTESGPKFEDEQPDNNDEMWANSNGESGFGSGPDMDDSYDENSDLSEGYNESADEYDDSFDNKYDDYQEENNINSTDDSQENLNQNLLTAQDVGITNTNPAEVRDLSELTVVPPTPAKNQNKKAESKDILPKPLKNLQELNNKEVEEDKSMSSRPAPKKRKNPAKQPDKNVIKEY